MTKKKLDALQQIFGCYFHQDWSTEFDSDEDAFRAMTASEPREKILSGMEEIDALLAASLSDVELKDILTEEVGCYFNPGSESLTYREWLMRARKRLAEV
ncbi:contact-dependent growth inhibition system immunity protein [Ralstonia solanacearum]|uniref:contact-dependent growth inhibition system immunity protein n=2 Tax=Ralstonia solanacearum TaxID=305 RepID=UPI0012D34049|nr:contact-dependent growth inhibition system immunity protein [Ralstonia solanacearum]